MRRIYDVVGAIGRWSRRPVRSLDRKCVAVVKTSMARLSDRNIHRDILHVNDIPWQSSSSRWRTFGNGNCRRCTSQRYKNSVIRTRFRFELAQFLDRFYVALDFTLFALRDIWIFNRLFSQPRLLCSSANPASRPTPSPSCGELFNARRETYANRRVSEILVFFVYVSLSRTISMTVQLWTPLCHELHQYAAIILGMSRAYHKFNLSDARNWDEWLN